MVFAISIVIWGVFAGCVIRARKEQGNVLQKVSMCLYKKVCTVGLLNERMKIRDRQILQSLASLHPGKETVQLLTEYYTGKIRVVILILLVGSGMACCIELAGEDNGVSISEGVISRPNEKQTVTLQAKVDAGGENVRDKIVLDIHERTLSEAEAESLYQELTDLLGEMILGENVSLQEIREDLVLPVEVEGYPFSISWKSSNRVFLSPEGIVYVEELEKTAEVSLEAEFIYGEYEWFYSWNLTLHPPERTAKEQLIYDLSKISKEAEAAQKYEENVMLPQTIDGKEVTWKIEKESSGLPILFLTILASVVVYFMKDKDLQDELIQRRIKMRLEYPAIMSKYALFLEAGLTVRGAFMKICRDYYEKETEPVHPLYEEMYYSCNELKAGVSESKVYENFGRRTGVQEYTRLCALLNQNLKKGNTALAKRLREESDEASRESLQLRKRQGEEAGTKLLAPMGMLLIMVLVMIMIPAFSGLGI